MSNKRILARMFVAWLTSGVTTYATFKLVEILAFPMYDAVAVVVGIMAGIGMGFLVIRKRHNAKESKAWSQTSRSESGDPPA